MKHLLLTTIAAVVLVGCGESQQSAPAPETKPVEPVAEAAKPEPPTAKAPDIPLWKAVSTKNIEAVKQHLAAATDVNVNGGPLGGTPLHYTYVGFDEIAELLLANGADVNTKDDDGKTTLDWVGSRGKMADLLRKHGGKTKKELEAEAK